MATYRLTPAGRRRLSEAARRNRPWRFSTGPRSPEGKSRSRRNALHLGFYLVKPEIEENSGVAMVRLARAVLFAGMVDEPLMREQRLNDLRKWLKRCEELTPDEPFVRYMRERLAETDWFSTGSPT